MRNRPGSAHLGCMKTLTGTDETPEREPGDLYATYRAEHGRLTSAVASVLRRAASLTRRNQAGAA